MKPTPYLKYMHSLLLQNNLAFISLMLILYSFHRSRKHSGLFPIQHYLFTRNESSVRYCESAHYLYRVLLQPFEKLLQNKKITIIPDGKIKLSAFDALLTEMPDTTGLIKFNNLPYVIHDHTINYSYSANLLYKFKKQTKTAKYRLMAFAPEYNPTPLF
jgi:CHAT domain-containing protein